MTEVQKAPPAGSTLSVVLPSYNHSRYLTASLEAIIGQSFKPKEILVIDDASTDDSVKIIESFARRHPVVRLLRNPRNMGVNAVRQRGIEESSGDYIIFPAADDPILPGLFEKSMSLLSRHPQAGLCSALARLIDADGRDVGPYETAVVSDKECFIAPDQFLATYRYYSNWIVTYTVILKRAAIAGVGGQDSELGPAADAWLNARVAMKYGACFIPEPLALWRRVESSYAQDYGKKDINKPLEKLDLVERRVLFPRDGSKPEPQELEFMRLWKRRVLCLHLLALNGWVPCPYDGIAKVKEHLPSLTLIDRIYFSGLPLWSRLGVFPTRLYLWTQQARWEQRQSLRHKLRAVL